MQRKHLTVVLVIFAAAAVGLSVMIGTAAGQTKSRAVAKPTVITVTAGKPTEFAFKLSKTANVTAGAVTFNVTNKGKIAHSFKICTKAVTADTANTCVGKATKQLNPGQTATLTVTLKKGAYEFLCTVDSHAETGMKGLIAIGEALPKATTVAKKGTTGKANAQGGANVCNTPTTTSFTVTMVEYSFSGVPTQLHCGTITVTEVEGAGDAETHNIDFQGVAGAAGPVLSPGQANATYSFMIYVGSYSYQCDVGDHAAQGMVGGVTVTD